MVEFTSLQTESDVNPILAIYLAQIHNHLLSTSYCQQVLQIDLQPRQRLIKFRRIEALSYKKRGQNAYMITLRKSLQNVGDINQVKLTNSAYPSVKPYVPRGRWCILEKRRQTAIILWQPLVRDWERVVAVQRPYVPTSPNVEWT
jgi:hypothetical protein